jgi:hypothetical protein
LFVADAGSLLDIAEADPSLIQLVTTHVGDLRIPVPALVKINNAKAREIQRLGVSIHECTTENLIEAGPNRLNLSFEERLCLITARDEKWTLVTHDLVLKRACDADGLTSACALDLLLQLLKGAHIGGETAKNIACNLRRLNPKFMTEERIDSYISETIKLSVRH